MKKKLILSIILFSCIATLSSAMQISTEKYNVFPFNPTKIKKIDVSYGITLIDYGFHHLAFYSTDDLSTPHGKQMAVNYHYLPKNTKSTDSHFVDKWVTSAKSYFNDKGETATVLPYPAKNGILILHKHSVEGLYLIDNIVYQSSLDVGNIPDKFKVQLAEKLINTINPQ